MIDSHCHLDHEPLFNNLQKILNRSKKNGITKLLTISTNFKSFKKIIDLVNIDPMIFGTFGIHPHETSTDLVTKDIIIKNINGNKKVIGVGETGLDFYYNHSEKEKQITSFKAHIEAAINLDVPLIVHSRNAETETFDILNLYKKDQPKILMHCFAGSKSFVNKLATLNSFFSASGIITFKNSTELQNTFKDIPQNKLLIETDSPFLAPIPMRGKKNEPSYIKYTTEKLAELKGLTFNEISEITTSNFNNLFFL
jgi:TatD DNase family protein